MHIQNTIASESLPRKNDSDLRPRRLEDIVYQSVTVAAILLVLSSVVF